MRIADRYYVERRAPRTSLSDVDADSPGRGQMRRASPRDAYIELSFGQFSTKSRPIGRPGRLTAAHLAE
ncbi:unnamed protein product, partial [Iphiclides podalirius]